MPDPQPRLGLVRVGSSLALMALATYVPHASALATPHFLDCSHCTAAWLRWLACLPGLALATIAEHMGERAARALSGGASDFGAARPVLAVAFTLAWLAASTWLAQRGGRWRVPVFACVLALASLNAFVLARLFAA
jgi:hypothetical protein